MDKALINKVAIVAAGVLVAGFIMNAAKNVDFIRNNVHSGFDS